MTPIHRSRWTPGEGGYAPHAGDGDFLEAVPSEYDATPYADENPEGSWTLTDGTETPTVELDLHRTAAADYEVIIHAVERRLWFDRT